MLPDLATYGKAIASGWPVAAVVGSAAVMDRLATNEVFHGGTYAGSTPSMAAVAATMDAIADGRVYERVAESGTRLMEGLASAARDGGLDVQVTGYPARFNILLDRRPYGDELYAQLWRSFAEEGIWVDFTRVARFVGARRTGGRRCRRGRIERIWASRRFRGPVIDLGVVVAGKERA